MKQRPKGAALGYNSRQDQAPRLLASGQGELAERMIALAREHHIPVHQDPALVETLLKLDLGTEIPAELYQVVAEIFVLVKRLEDRHSRR